MSAEFQVVHERLEKVERENRTLKRFGLAILLIVAAAVAMGQARPNRTVEAENFVLKDPSGRMRAQIYMDPSGTPSLEFFDENGKRGSYFRGGDLMFLGKTGYTRMSEDGIMISNQKGHIDLGTETLLLKITSTADGGYGYVSLGMAEALSHQGVIGPSLTLSGNKGRGFVELDTADGPRLHLEPGMSDGKVLPGGFVDITSQGPLMQITDQQGFTTTIGSFKLRDKKTGETLKTSTASIVLAAKDNVLWSAPR
jgi:hypothetical protein